MVRLSLFWQCFELILNGFWAAEPYICIVFLNQRVKGPLGELRTFANPEKL